MVRGAIGPVCACDLRDASASLVLRRARDVDPQGRNHTPVPYLELFMVAIPWTATTASPLLITLSYQQKKPRSSRGRLRASIY